MHSSGPRPKSHCGSPTITSAPTKLGLPQFSCAVPAVELPVGEQCTASCWPLGFPAGVLPLLNTTTSEPSGRTTGSDPWLKSHWCSLCVGSNTFPKKHSVGETPLISSGVENVWAPSVDIEPK